MSRILMGVVLGALVSVAAAAAGEDRDRPPSSPKKTDSKPERSLTGVVEKIDAKDNHTGTLVLLSGDQRYTIQIDKKTKILQKTADPLEMGLKNAKLKGARARVLYVEVRQKADNGKSVDVHLARTIQVLKAKK